VGGPALGRQRPADHRLRRLHIPQSDGKTVDWFIVGLAVQRNYLSVYVNATEGRAYLAERYAKRLGKVRVGKSSIGFASIDDVDLDQLSELITEAKRLMT